jgi:competence protein ComEC
MIPFAFSFISGIAVYNFFPFFPISIITLCSTVTFLLFRYSKDRKKGLLIILTFAFGIFYSFLRHDSIPEIKMPNEAVVEGTIVNVPEISGEKIRFTLTEVYINETRIQGKIRLFILSERIFLLPASGDRIRAIVRLKEPNFFHNPGVYSYDLKKKGIVAVGYIKQMQILNKSNGILSWINRRRQALGEIIDNSLSKDVASFHKAIIPGLKSGIGQDMRDSFSATGLAHLLSISGTHFGLLAFIIFKTIKIIVKFFPLRILTGMTLYITPTQIAIILTLPLLIFYALISGTSTPTVRSLIMVFIYMLALFLGRRDQWLNSLAIAAMVILFWQPGALFDLSFQLSFIAVFSIGYILEKRSRDESENLDFQKVVNKVKTAVLITLAAVFGTAPVVALVFKQFPLISPVTNLLITPIVCFIILPLGFFTGFITLLFNMSSLPLSKLTDMITGFTLNLIRVFAEIPYSNLRVPNPSFIIMVLYFLSLMFIFKSRVKWRFLPFILIICFYFLTPHLSTNYFNITFLDVGQGDSAIVEFPDKKVLLIDGGTSDPDTGRMVIAPYLWSKGIRKIDFIALTHPHPDHYGGLIYIMDNFKVGEIWLNGRILPEAKEFFQKIQEKRIFQRVLRRGDVFEAGEYKIYIFHPYDEFFADSPRGEFSVQNNDSLVLKIESKNGSILFTGDIEKEAEEDLIHLGKWLKSDIIKVPHHGGRTSSSKKFLEMVNPKIAVISVGKGNPFNHPHRETLERYKNRGVRLFMTDIHGAVIVTLKGENPEIMTYWDSRLKKVMNWRDEVKNLSLLL